MKLLISLAIIFPVMAAADVVKEVDTDCEAAKAKAIHTISQRSGVVETVKRIQQTNSTLASKQTINFTNSSSITSFTTSIDRQSGLCTATIAYSPNAYTKSLEKISENASTLTKLINAESGSISSPATQTTFHDNQIESVLQAVDILNRKAAERQISTLNAKVIEKMMILDSAIAEYTKVKYGSLSVASSKNKIQTELDVISYIPLYNVQSVFNLAKASNLGDAILDIKSSRILIKTEYPPAQIIEPKQTFVDRDGNRWYYSNIDAENSLILDKIVRTLEPVDINRWRDSKDVECYFNGDIENRCQFIERIIRQRKSQYIVIPLEQKINFKEFDIYNPYVDSFD